MFRDPTNLNNPDWEIAVVRSRWTQSNFPFGQPLQLSMDVFQDDTHYPSIDEEGTPDWSPDVAYDLETGDVHVVWTTWSTSQSNPARLAYMWYDRSGSEWSGQYIVYEQGNAMNQWIPRIAIGYPGAAFGYVVAVVYSEWQAGISKIHVGGACWPPGTNPNSTADFFHLPYDTGYDAGLPRIAITPRYLAVNYGTIIFTQSLGDEDEDGYEEFQVIEVNNVRDAEEYLDYFWPIEKNDNPYGIFGSIACHFEPGEEASASFNYFEQHSGGWRVANGRFDPTESQPPEVEWTVMTGDGASVTGVLEWPDYVGYTYAHTIQASDIATIYVPDTWDNAYWVAWCDAIDQDATEVYAAFGDTTPG